MRVLAINQKQALELAAQFIKIFPKDTIVIEYIEDAGFADLKRYEVYKKFQA